MWIHNRGDHKLTLEHKMVSHTVEGYVSIKVINAFPLWIYRIPGMYMLHCLYIQTLLKSLRYPEKNPMKARKPFLAKKASFSNSTHRLKYIQNLTQTFTQYQATLLERKICADSQCFGCSLKCSVQKHEDPVALEWLH